MPIIKSAIKRVRQTAVRSARNNITKRGLKQARRALDACLATKGSKNNLSELLSAVQAQLDTAVKKNLLHKNQAARLKSRYAHAVKAAGAKPINKKAAKTSKPAVKKTSAKRPAKKAPARKK